MWHVGVYTWLANRGFVWACHGGYTNTGAYRCFSPNRKIFPITVHRVPEPIPHDRCLIGTKILIPRFKVPKSTTYKDIGFQDIHTHPPISEDSGRESADLPHLPTDPAPLRNGQYHLEVDARLDQKFNMEWNGLKIYRNMLKLSQTKLKNTKYGNLPGTVHVYNYKNS